MKVVCFMASVVSIGGVKRHGFATSLSRAYDFVVLSLLEETASLSPNMIKLRCIMNWGGE